MPEKKCDTICVAAQFSALPQLLAPLAPDALWVSAPHEGQTLLRAQLAVEELFANSVHHGYGGESESPVWLTIERDTTVLRIIYSDQAAAFDPFTAIKTPTDDPGASLEGREVGGVGRLLVRELARRSSYARMSDRNVTTLEFALGPKPAAPRLANS